MPVPAVAVADGETGGHIQGREQGRNSIALGIMRLSGRYAGSQWQNRLGAVQRLHLALFIHAQHQGAIRRIQVQPEDVPAPFRRTEDLWRT